VEGEPGKKKEALGETNGYKVNGNVINNNKYFIIKKSR